MGMKCYFCETENDSVQPTPRAGYGEIPNCHLCAAMERPDLENADILAVLSHISHVGNKILEAIDTTFTSEEFAHVLWNTPMPDAGEEEEPL